MLRGGGGLWPSLKTAENASNGAVQTASGETLTWSDFVNAVKNIPSDADVISAATAYNTAKNTTSTKKSAYETAKSTTSTKKTAYENAKKAYDDAEADLKTWQTEYDRHYKLSTSTDVTNRDKYLSEYNALNTEVSNLEKAITYNENLYNNWPTTWKKSGELRDGRDVGIQRLENAASWLSGSGTGFLYVNNMTSSGVDVWVGVAAQPTFAGQQQNVTGTIFTAVAISDIEALVKATSGTSTSYRMRFWTGQRWYIDSTSSESYAMGWGMTMASVVRTLREDIDYIRNNDLNYTGA